MTRPQKITLGILATIICILSIFVLNQGMQAYQAWSQQPLGPVLDYPTPQQLPATWTPTQPGTPLPTFTLAPVTPTVTPKFVSPFLPCRNLPTMTLLAIGTDSHDDDYKYGRADMIRAVRVDFMAQRIVALEFPRDMWVEIPEVLDNLGTKYQKLNTAYTYGNPGLGYWDHPSQGPGLLASTLDLNFGLKADNYIAVSMNVFVEVVDALGGLEVTLPAEGVDGRTAYDRSKRLVFPGGEQTLTGEQALTLARIRNKDVFQRADNQNLVLCALQEKVESPEIIPHLPVIINSFRRHIQTDLTPEQISQLACLGTTMSRSNILFVSFPRKLFKNDMVYDRVAKQDVFVWDTDFEMLRDYVRQFNAGTWPISSPFAPPAPDTSSCE